MGKAILIVMSLALAIGVRAEQIDPSPDKSAEKTHPDAGNPQKRDLGGDAARTGGGRAEMMLSRIREVLQDLNLSEEQKSKIQEIFTSTKQEMRQAIGDLQNLEPQQRQQKMREMLSSVRGKVEAVLTEEQAAKLQEKLSNLRGPGARPGKDGERKRGQPDGGRPNAEGSNRPGSKPGAELPGQGPLRIAATLKRLEESIAALQLSSEQKTQVDAIVEDGKKQIAELREKLGSGAIQPEQMREEAPRVFAGMRDQLADVLTRDQQLKLRDEIQSRVERDGASQFKPDPTTKPAMKMEPFDDPKPEAAMRREPQRAADPTPPPQAAIAPDTGPKVGAAAPELNLERLDGRSAVLSTFKSKPLVIEFGSYSSPSFRQRASKMEDLAKQYGTRANFLVVYTKEAHPVGGWEVERNREEGINMSAHADLAARKAAAKDAKQALKITLPIALDTMDDRVAAAYGAGQNSALIIGRDGTILTRQVWCDPFRLRAALDEALAAKPATAPTAE